MNGAFERHAATVRTLIRESFPTTPMYVNGRLQPLPAVPHTAAQVTEHWLSRIVKEAHECAVIDAMASVRQPEPLYRAYTESLPKWSGILQDMFASSYDTFRDMGCAGEQMNSTRVKEDVRLWLADMIAERER